MNDTPNWLLEIIKACKSDVLTRLNSFLLANEESHS